MGRIRTVKPELPQQPWFATLTDAAARLFYGLLALVDDCGRCPADRAYIGGQIFWGKPRPANVIGRLLTELEQAQTIHRYVVRGAEYLEIVGWDVRGGPLYQQINKPQGERFPGPESLQDRPRTGPGSGSDPKGSETNRREENGEGERARAPARSQVPEPVAPPPAPVRTDTPSPSLLPVDWEPSESERNQAATADAIARGVDVRLQLEAFRDRMSSTGETSCDWDARWHTWVIKSYPEKQRGTGSPLFRAAMGSIHRGRVEPLPSSEYTESGDQPLDTSADDILVHGPSGAIVERFSRSTGKLKWRQSGYNKPPDVLDPMDEGYDATRDPLCGHMPHAPAELHAALESAEVTTDGNGNVRDLGPFRAALAPYLEVRAGGESGAT